MKVMVNRIIVEAIRCVNFFLFFNGSFGIQQFSQEMNVAGPKWMLSAFLLLEVCFYDFMLIRFIGNNQNVLQHMCVVG